MQHSSEPASVGTSRRSCRLQSLASPFTAAYVLCRDEPAARARWRASPGPRASAPGAAIEGYGHGRALHVAASRAPLARLCLLVAELDFICTSFLQ